MLDGKGEAVVGMAVVVGDTTIVVVVVMVAIILVDISSGGIDTGLVGIDVIIELADIVSVAIMKIALLEELMPRACAIRNSRITQWYCIQIT